MRLIVCLAATWSLTACGQNPPTRAESTTEPSFEVAEWPQLPSGFSFGQVVGVAVDSTDRVFVFHRAGAEFDNEEIITQPTVAVIDAATGEFLDQWGMDLFIVPHGLAIDASDHVWATDVGADAVFELTTDGDVVQRLDGAKP